LCVLGEGEERGNQGQKTARETNRVVGWEDVNLVLGKRVGSEKSVHEPEKTSQKKWVNRMFSVNAGNKRKRKGGGGGPGPGGALGWQDPKNSRTTSRKDPTRRGGGSG